MWTVVGVTRCSSAWRPSHQSCQDKILEICITPLYIYIYTYIYTVSFVTYICTLLYIYIYIQCFCVAAFLVHTPIYIQCLLCHTPIYIYIYIYTATFTPSYNISFDSFLNLTSITLFHHSLARSFCIIIYFNKTSEVFQIPLSCTIPPHRDFKAPHNFFATIHSLSVCLFAQLQHNNQCLQTPPTKPTDIRCIMQIMFVWYFASIPTHCLECPTLEYGNCHSWRILILILPYIVWFKVLCAFNSSTLEL